MTKRIKLFSNVALSTIVLGMGVTCCSLATTLNANSKQIKAEAPIPKELLRYDDNTVYGFASGVDKKQLYLSGYTRLDLSNDFLGADIKKIAPFAFANAFTGLECPITGLTLPENLEVIGQAAFFECGALGGNKLYLPNNGTLKVIDADAFFYTHFISDLTIPDGVEKIGKQAFAYDDSFTGTIKIPSSVTEVGFRAFKGASTANGIDLSEYPRIPKWLCSQATIFQDIGGEESPEVTVKVSTQENSEDDWLAILKQQGLGEKSKIQSVDGNPTTDACFTYEGTKNEIVTGFAEGVDLSQYQTLKFPDSVTTIKNDAFKDKIKEHKLRFTMPNAITSYGDNAFLNCSGLLCNNMSVPAEVTHIGNNAFQNCAGITGTLTFPAGITTDGFVVEGNEAFKGCTGITGLKVDKTDHFNGYGMFQGCSSLSMLDFSDYTNQTANQIQELWPKAQQDPDKHLPLDGISKNGMLYYSEDSLMTEILAWKELVTSYLSNWETIHPDNMDAATADKASRKNWQVQARVVDVEVPEMDGFILENKEICHGVSKRYRSEITNRNVIRIPTVVTTIATDAFKDLLIPRENIDRWKLILNLGLNQIQDSAFENCNGIVDELIIPNTVENVGNRAFYGCSNVIGTLSLPKSLKSVGDSSFVDTRIHSLVFSNLITNIGASAFAQNPFIQVVDLTCFSSVPTSLTIGDNAFAFAAAGSSALSLNGTVYVASGTEDAWKTLLQSKGLPADWQVVGVA